MKFDFNWPSGFIQMRCLKNVDGQQTPESGILLAYP